MKARAARWVKSPRGTLPYSTQAVPSLPVREMFYERLRGLVRD